MSVVRKVTRYNTNIDDLISSLILAHIATHRTKFENVSITGLGKPSFKVVFPVKQFNCFKESSKTFSIWLKRNIYINIEKQRVRAQSRRLF